MVLFPKEGTAVVFRRAGLNSYDDGKATCLRLLDFITAPMRAFHLSWFGFFVSFVAWFAIAPLMAVVRDDLKLTKEQIGNTVIASVAITIVARLVAGWLCDRYGPRRTYSALLLLGALPVVGIGLAHSYASFLLFRLAIGGLERRLSSRNTTLRLCLRLALWAQRTQSPRAGAISAAESRNGSCRCCSERSPDSARTSS